MVKRQPLFMEVADKLTDLILAKYPPGSKIPTEPDLSERFGASRTTIREAVKLLCSQNILEIRRGDGTYVTKEPGVTDDPLGLRFIDEVDRINDIAEFSLILQPEAAALAARKVTPLDLKHLRNTEEAFREGLNAYDAGKITVFALRDLDREFHSVLMRACHNYLMDKLDGILKSLGNNNAEDMMKVVESSLRYHQQILSAVEAHDEKRARQAMASHIQEQIGYLLKAE